MKLLESKIISEGDAQYKVETYDNGAVVKTRYVDPKEIPQIEEPKEPETETEITQDEINAEILLNQANIQAKQIEQDEVLAELLLNTVSN